MTLKDIPFFPGYKVSPEGHVYSTKRGDLTRLKGRPGRNQYLRVYMRDSRDNKRKDRYVHRLVAQAFIPREEGKDIVNHIDSDRQNNHVDNLEWSTYAENNKDTRKKGHVIRCEDTGRFISGLME